MPLIVTRYANLVAVTPKQIETEAWRTFLAGLAQWDHWVTLTLSCERTEKAVAALTAAWLRRVNQRAGTTVRSTFVLERAGGRGRVHAHVLLVGSRGLRTREIAEAWRGAGFTRCVVYDASLGAAGYLANMIASGTGTEYLPVKAFGDMAGRRAEGRDARAIGSDCCPSRRNAC